MKTLTWYMLLLVAGICAFVSCSKPMEPEQPVVPTETMTRSALDEQLAYDQLLQQLDSLNAAYASDTPMMQYAAGAKPTRFKRILRVVLADALGAVIGCCTPAPIVGGAIGGVLASVAAAKCKNSTFTISINGWNLSVSEYINETNGDEYDETSRCHNELVTYVLERYTTDQLVNMTESELFYAIMRAYTECGYQLDENFNSYLMPIPTIYNVYDETDNYPLFLNKLATQRPTISNQCQVMKTYCDGMNRIDESQCLDYHIDFRNTVQASNISASAKQNLRLCIGVGYGSANLWDVVDEAE